MHRDGLGTLNQALFARNCMAQPSRCRTLEEPLCPPKAAVRVRRLLLQEYKKQEHAYDDDEDEDEEDSDDEPGDGLEPFRGVPVRQQVTARMRAGLVGTPGLPSSGEPVEVCPGVFASGSKWARDHEWAAAHSVTTMVDVGCFTWARGRAATRARVRIPLEAADRPLPRCSLHFAHEDVQDLAAHMREAHEGFLTVGGRHAPREQPGAVLVYCSTGQVARLAAVTALLMMGARVAAKDVCTAGRCVLCDGDGDGDGNGNGKVGGRDVLVCPTDPEAKSRRGEVPHVHVLPVR